jgi:sugar lactone lactonase YvrE
LAVRLLLIAGAVAGQARAAGSLIQALFHSGQANGNYGPAYQAETMAAHLAIDAAGNIYVLDGWNLPYDSGPVRKITLGGAIVPVAGFGTSALPPGLSTPALLAGVGYASAMALDPQGEIYISPLSGAFFRIGTDGQASAYATPAPRPIMALAADAAGNLYALEASPQFFQGGYEVIKVLPDGTSVAFAGTSVAGYSGDGGPATSAQINASDLALDSSGNLFIADYNYLIRKVDAPGIINTVAQGTGPITVDSSRNLYCFLQDGTLERLAPGGTISTLATVPEAGGVAVDSAGNVFVSSSGRVYELDASGAMQLIAGCACYGDGVPVTWVTAVSPIGVARDTSGNVYFSDQGNHTVRRVAPDGTFTLAAGTGDPGFSGDGGPARQARLSSPSGLALDSAGNLYIADRGNSRIREVIADGTIQTVAGSAVAGFYGDGGPATAAQIALPDGVAVDSQGNIYIADTANHRIRKVTTEGIIQTIAGSSNYGTSGDGGPASLALLINPRVLVFDLNGNLLISDSSAHMVRRITPSGLIQRVSGTGVAGHTGDGGPATSAEDWTPWGLAVDAAGNIYIGDTGSSYIRVVNPAGIIQTLAEVYNPTGLVTDSAGNPWIAGDSLNILAEGGLPIPLAPMISPDGVALRCFCWGNGYQVHGRR